MATIKASPTLASHAEKVNINIGKVKYDKISNWVDHNDKAIKSASIIPSRQSRAERRWTRWSAIPIIPNENVVKKTIYVGDIKYFWILTKVY